MRFHPDIMTAVLEFIDKNPQSTEGMHAQVRAAVAQRDSEAITVNKATVDYHRWLAFTEGLIATFGGVGSTSVVGLTVRGTNFLEHGAALDAAEFELSTRLTGIALGIEDLVNRLDAFLDLIDKRLP